MWARMAASAARAVHRRVSARAAAICAQEAAADLRDAANERQRPAAEAADLNADDDEAAAARPRELRVGVAALAPGGIVNGPSGLRVSTWV